MISFYRFRELREKEILLQEGEEKKKGLFCILYSCGQLQGSFV